MAGGWFFLSRYSIFFEQVLPVNCAEMWVRPLFLIQASSNAGVGAARHVVLRVALCALDVGNLSSSGGFVPSIPKVDLGGGE
jgi:hypothetical protein